MTDRASDLIVAVVDDDARILRSLGDLLESADYGVRLFTSASAILESGCLSESDCLISDIDMPGIDGFELLRLVQGARPGLPIILITGYPDRLKRLPSSSLTGTRFFTKPFQGPALLSAVGEAISSFRK
jgi:FixJ family two-component response regulator